MDYNPFLPEVQANPYPYYAYLREHAPVYQVPGAGFWAVSRYDDVLYVIRNPQLFTSSTLFAAFMGDLNPFPPEAPAIVGCDPPSHTRLRKLVNRAFTPRRVASLEQHIREITHQLIAQIPIQGTFDLVGELSAPLPVTVIAELLGVPAERRDDFKGWADAFIRATSGKAVPLEEQAELRQNFVEFRAYFENAIALARRQPGDNLLSDLIRVEEENQTLTSAEIVSLAMFLIIGGSETTTNLIANAIMALCDHPEQMAQVRANRALIPQMVEEALRYVGPIHAIFRQATQEVEVAGTKLPAGSLVLFLLGSANRDARKFPDPDRFDIMRNTEGHVGFGFGVHFCLGAQLARLQAKVALEMVLERFPGLSRTDAPVRWIEAFSVRGPKMLPLVVS